MAVFRLNAFLGENRALHPKLLPEGAGVLSQNQKPGRGDLRPWRGPLPVATSVAGAKTIYRMGRDVVSDTNYWLSWTDQVHVVRGPNANDTAERTYYSGHGAPKWTDTSKALASAPYPTSYRDLGIPAPTNILTLTASGGSSSATEVRYYVYTHVSDIGEESAPSPVSLPLTCKPDDIVTIGNLDNTTSGSQNVTQLRIYRTQAGTSGAAEFYFLKEVSASATSAQDLGEELGEVLPSADWLPPPSNLKWLTGLWNGMMAGISGRSVRVCEAYVPYAWPAAYEILPLHTTPVAMATFGQTLVVVTDGNPFTVTGGTPDSLDQQPVEFLQACVSAESTVGMGHGVAWASPDGLAYIGTEGARLLTSGILTREDWQAIHPETLIGRMVEGRYVGFYNDGTPKGFVLDPRNPSGLFFLDFGADALYLDEIRDSLFVLNGTAIGKWDSGATKTVTFRGKVFQLPKAVPGPACAQVVADTYPLTFKLIVDGTVKHTETVASDEAFRLPGGYHAQTLQMEVIANGPVQAVTMAHSMQELATTA